MAVPKLTVQQFYGGVDTLLSMRIIAGTAKGRRLVGPRGLDTRPLTDRAKEALFSSLGSRMADAAVLDLFAGTGSLGLEALSRGATSAVFVERDPKAIAALTTNLAGVGLGGEIKRRDVTTFLSGCRDRFDVVFVDPPYAFDNESIESVMALVAGVMTPAATVIVHRRRGSDQPQVPEGLQLLDARRYGDVELWRFVKEDT